MRNPRSRIRPFTIALALAGAGCGRIGYDAVPHDADAGQSLDGAIDGSGMDVAQDLSPSDTPSDAPTGDALDTLASDVRDGAEVTAADVADASDVVIDAACADAMSVNACGPTCMPCPVPMNGSATCAAGACGITCNAGFYASGAMCLPIPAPQPIAPLSTAIATSQRPTFHWRLAPGTDGAAIDLCADRACSAISSTTMATGTSGQPPAALTHGVYYWRLHGAVGTNVGTATSPVWEVFIGHRSAPADTSWDTIPDFDGDGHAEVAVGADDVLTQTGRMYIYEGSATGPAAAATLVLTGPDGTHGAFGHTAGSAGDVNGDGYTDLVVGAWQVLSSTGSAYVYLGGPSGIASTPVATMPGPDGSNTYYSFGIATAGDVNGDGYADIIVGAYSALSNQGRAYLYLGSANGTVTTPAVVIDGQTPNEQFGFSVASAGDVNADGYSDVVVGAPYTNSEVGAAYVFYGSATGLSTTPSATISGPDGAHSDFGISVRTAGDVNGDGYADLVVGAWKLGPGYGHIYLGGPSGIATTSSADLVGPGGNNSGFGWAIGTAGDVNGDGYSDVIAGAFNAATMAGESYVYLGGSGGLSTTAAQTLSSPDLGNNWFGRAVSECGDLDGDGLDDVIVGSDQDMSNTGSAFVYTGTANGVVTTPWKSWLGPDAGMGYFGVSVSSRWRVGADRLAWWPSRARVSHPSCTAMRH